MWLRCGAVATLRCSGVVCGPHLMFLRQGSTPEAYGSGGVEVFGPLPLDRVDMNQINALLSATYRRAR